MEIIKRRPNVRVEHDSSLSERRVSRSWVILRWVTSLYEVMSLLIASRSSCANASIFYEQTVWATRLCPGQTWTTDGCCAHWSARATVTNTKETMGQDLDTSEPRSFCLCPIMPFMVTPNWALWTLKRSRMNGNKKRRKWQAWRQEIKRCLGPC